MLKMKEQYLMRGSGFISSRLKSLLPTALYLPRDWVEVPKADRIIYTAGYGNYYDQKDIHETYKANITEVLRLIPYTDKSFVYISTSSVLLPVQTEYSRSKKIMEDLIIRSEYPVVAVRPSSVTGVGEQERHLIPTLIRSCIDGEEMPFVGEPTHDYIDVDDFAREVIYVSTKMRKYRNKVVNLSSGVIYSNYEVKNMVEEITGKKANVKMVESMRKYDTHKWEIEPDLYKAEKPLCLSIKEMVDDYLAEKGTKPITL